MGTIRHNEIAISTPAGWTDSSQVIALGPVDNGFRPNLVVTFEPTREPMEKLAARHLAGLKGSLKGFALVKEGPAEFGRNKGLLREYTFQASGQKLSQLQLYVVVKEVGYVATFTHLANRMAAVRKAAEGIFAGLALGA